MLVKRNEDVKAWSEEDKQTFMKAFEKRCKERVFLPRDCSAPIITIKPIPKQQ